MSTLSQYLKSSGKTQAEFAREISVTQGYVAKLCSEAGPVPTLKVAVRIEAATKGAVPVSIWAERAA